MKHKACCLNLILLFAIFSSGCFRDAPIKFYLIEPHVPSPSQPVTLSSKANDTVIGLGPVHIPEYLNRPQMVMGMGDYEYRLDEHHRWAERLDDNISRVLLQSLSSQLPFQIVRYPGSLRQKIDYQISVDVLELHQDSQGYSRTSVHWVIKNREKTFSAKNYACKLPVPKDDYDGQVKAQSDCIASLSEEIAKTLNKLLTSRDLRPQVR